MVVGRGELGLARLRFENPDVRARPDAPQLDGWKLRDPGAEGIGTPIVVVSARGTEHDRVHALEIGADDYLVKPFSMRELVARVGAAARRGVAPAGERRGDPVEIEELLIDPREVQAFVDGKSAGLTPTEFRLLYTLALDRGRVVTRDELLQKVWGRRETHRDRTVDVFVRRLRQKLDRLVARPFVHPDALRRRLQARGAAQGLSRLTASGRVVRRPGDAAAADRRTRDRARARARRLRRRRGQLELLDLRHDHRGELAVLEHGRRDDGSGDDQDEDETAGETTTAVAAGDATAGREVYLSTGCGSCHVLQQAGTDGSVGPNLDERLVSDADDAGGPLEDFVRTSIEDPDEHVASGYQARRDAGQLRRHALERAARRPGRVHHPVGAVARARPLGSARGLRTHGRAARDPFARPRSRRGRDRAARAEWDRAHAFPRELLAKLAEVGLLGVCVPEEHGGAGADFLSYVLVLEELSRADAGVGVTVAVHTSACTLPLLDFGEGGAARAVRAAARARRDDRRLRAHRVRLGVGRGRARTRAERTAAGGGSRGRSNGSRTARSRGRSSSSHAPTSRSPERAASRRSCSTRSTSR